MHGLLCLLVACEYRAGHWLFMRSDYWHSIVALCDPSAVPYERSKRGPFLYEPDIHLDIDIYCCICCPLLDQETHEFYYLSRLS